jgi:hypothetical protein
VPHKVTVLLDMVGTSKDTRVIDIPSEDESQLSSDSAFQLETSSPSEISLPDTNFELALTSLYQKTVAIDELDGGDRGIVQYAKRLVWHA